MNELQTFNNVEFGEVRTIVMDNEPFFVGKDVAEILGYTNPLKAIRDHVDEEDKGVNETFTPGGIQNLFEIKESTHLNGNGAVIVSKTPKVTGKGQSHFINGFLSGRFTI